MPVTLCKGWQSGSNILSWCVRQFRWHSLSNSITLGYFQSAALCRLERATFSLQRSAERAEAYMIAVHTRSASYMRCDGACLAAIAQKFMHPAWQKTLYAAKRSAPAGAMIICIMAFSIERFVRSVPARHQSCAGNRQHWLFDNHHIHMHAGGISKASALPDGIKIPLSYPASSFGRDTHASQPILSIPQQAIMMAARNVLKNLCGTLLSTTLCRIVLGPSHFHMPCTRNLQNRVCDVPKLFPTPCIVCQHFEASQLAASGRNERDFSCGNEGLRVTHIYRVFWPIGCERDAQEAHAVTHTYNVYLSVYTNRMPLWLYKHAGRALADSVV